MTSHIFSVGDVVWAKTGFLSYEEPATVLKLGCEYTYTPSEDDDDEEEEAEEKEEKSSSPYFGKKKNDGLLLKLQVSQCRRVLPPTAVRLYKEEEEEEDGPNPKRRRAARSKSPATKDREALNPTVDHLPKNRDTNDDRHLVTPSPPLEANKDQNKKPAARRTIIKVKEEEREEEDENDKAAVETKDDIDVKPDSATSGTTKTKRKRKQETATTATAKKAAATTAKKAAAGKAKKQNGSAPKKKVSSKTNGKVVKRSGKASAAAKKKETSTAIVITPPPTASASAKDDNNYISSDDDINDDKPYQVGYSPSNRATCRSCDEIIKKGCVRISHRPLFNGKPGFCVYRHLKCQVFSENIDDVKQIGGYRRLKKDDLTALEERLVESKKELELENQELEPDELVQQTFGNKKQLVKRKVNNGKEEKEEEVEIEEVLLEQASIRGLDASLLPFQVEGVSWMVHQETKIPELRGGILADEMGMGKTLQTISTILANRPKLQHCAVGAKHPPSADDLVQRQNEEVLWNKSFEDWVHEMKMNKVDLDNIGKKNTIRTKLLEDTATTKKSASSRRGGNNNNNSNNTNRRAGTLVVCPVIAIIQWKLEIEKFVNMNDSQNKLTIATYHGPNRTKEYPCIEMLQKYDIVLTTYQVLESDFRKMVSPNKVTCPNCGAKFKIDKLRIHLKYFCGETAQRTEAQSRQRRTADRHNNSNNNNNNRRGGSRGGTKPDKKKKAFKSFSKTTKTKGTVKEEEDSGSDSETDEEEEEKKVATKRNSGKVAETNGKDSNKGKKRSSTVTSKADPKAKRPQPLQTTARPSRSAAVSASKRMSASVKEWGEKGNTNYDDDDDVASVMGGTDDNDDDDDDESLGSVESEDSDGSVIDNSNGKKRKQPIKKKQRSSKKTKKATQKRQDSSSEEEEEEEEEDEALARARKKQRLAMDQAKKGNKKKLEKKKSFLKESKGSKGKKNKPAAKKTSKKKMPAKKKGKKKYVDESGSSSSESYDTESSEDGEPGDPLEGVDLEALMKEAMAGAKMSILHSLCWWRIVLDEAHFIKSRSSQTSSAAFALTGIHRWALSGTPLQNRVGELYSLIRFLRIDPMAHYFCRKAGCGCKSIHYRMEHGKCLGCGHAAFMHYSHFNKHVLNPIQREGYTGDGRRAMFKLKNEVLDQCLMRRTKESRAEDMNLPPRIVTIRPIKLHPVEEDFYNALYTQTRSSFDDYVAEGTLLNNYAHIFDLLTKMRQAVDHPYLIVYSTKNCAAKNANNNPQQPAVANGSVDCDLCHEPPTDRLVSSCCGAAFCRSCVTEYMTPSLAREADNNNGTPCPSCSAPFSIDFSQESSNIVDDSTLTIPSRGAGDSKTFSNSSSAAMPSLKEIKHVNSGSILRRINLAEFATSTKIEVLVQELIKMRKMRPGSKALVFSQFVNMLDLIRWRIHSDPCLADMGLGVRILHGGMDVKARDETLKDFREDNGVRILLMSLKAGGVALNLTVASEVYLMDNWWNPAAEMQAIDRTHRLGQYRPIRAVRFIAEGTVEERVLQLQEKKRLVFDGTVGRDAGSLKMLTGEDMKALFA